MTLFVVATPIGNLDDLTRRAESTLRSVARVVAEDTRRTRALLAHLGIEGKPVDRLDAHASDRDVARVVERLVAGEDVAIVTDAGTPAVSDPGAKLVRQAAHRGVSIVPIPGPSAVATAIAAAGFEGAGFRFAGFLPRSGPERDDAMEKLASSREITVFFESPNRLAETLADLAKVAPDREVLVARELTKMHEELARGTASELAERADWLGEITVVVAARSDAEEVEATDEDVERWIDEELARGASAKDAAHVVAARSGRPKRDVYARVLRRR